MTSLDNATRETCYQSYLWGYGSFSQLILMYFISTFNYECNRQPEAVWVWEWWNTSNPYWHRTSGKIGIGGKLAPGTWRLWPGERGALVTIHTAKWTDVTSYTFQDLAGNRQTFKTGKWTIHELLFIFNCYHAMPYILVTESWALISVHINTGIHMTIDIWI